MFEEINNSDDDLDRMTDSVHEVIDWSKDRMHTLVEDEEIDDATAIYFEFSEWYDPNAEFEVVIIDEAFNKLMRDMFDENINNSD